MLCLSVQTHANTEKTMDKVADMSVVERKVEESAEESKPKTVSPGTRKRPAISGVKADETRETNAGEKKKPREHVILSEINKVDEALQRDEERMEPGPWRES